MMYRCILELSLQMMSYVSWQVCPSVCPSIRLPTNRLDFFDLNKQYQYCSKFFM